MTMEHRAARKSGPRTNLYDDITDKIIAELEDGRLPWVQPWGTAAAQAPLAMPRNAATSRQYSGINVLILWGAVIQQGYPTQHWLTFRQALSLGGNVRKGERGTTVVYADRFVPEDEKCYTWWSYRNKDWEKSNRGRRLDHVWVSPPLAEALRGHEILTAARNWEKPSDHVPLIVDFKL